MGLGNKVVFALEQEIYSAPIRRSWANSLDLFLFEKNLVLPMNLLPSQRTKFTRNEDIKKQWVLIDAKDQTLGRVASQVAYRLLGKHRTDFSTHQDIGDYIVVTNAKHIKVSGNKMEQKEYYEHSNHPGGLKITKLRQKMEKDPIYAIKTAVKRMLPSGARGRKILDNLKVFAGEQHDHKAQKPVEIQLTYKG